MIHLWEPNSAGSLPVNHWIRNYEVAYIICWAIAIAEEQRGRKGLGAHHKLRCNKGKINLPENFQKFSKKKEIFCDKISHHQCECKKTLLERLFFLLRKKNVKHHSFNRNTIEKNSLHFNSNNENKNEFVWKNFRENVSNLNLNLAIRTYIC